MCIVAVHEALQTPFSGLATGRARQLRPDISDLDFLRDLKGVIDFDA